jgi:hypothetical protein
MADPILQKLLADKPLPQDARSRRDKALPKVQIP